MRLVSQSDLRAPFNCLLCKRDGDLVDTLQDLDAYPGWEGNGAIYLCPTCAGDAAGTVGWVSGDIHSAALNQIDALAMENAVLREKHLEDTDRVIAAVRERMEKPKPIRVKKVPVPGPDESRASDDGMPEVTA